VYRDLDAVTAVAQHCGLDTLFVDFTTEPEAAAFIVKCPFSHFDFEKLARVFGEEAAQPGLFTLHLQDTALEDFEDPWLTRYRLAGPAVAEASRFLKVMGVNDFSLFPDLDGLSRFLRKRIKGGWGIVA